MSPVLVLIHPPVSKPCEPPAGIGKLCGALLNGSRIKCSVVDANMEGILYLLKEPFAPTDTWTRRALRHHSGHIASLKNWRIYQHPDRYKRAITDLNRVLEMVTLPGGFRLGLANFDHPGISPARSGDLIRAAEVPETNPFYPYFKNRLLKILESEQPSVVGLSLNYLSQAV